MKNKLLSIMSLILTPILILILFTQINLKKIPDKIYSSTDIPVNSFVPIGNTLNKVDNSNNKYAIKFLGMIPVKCVEMNKIEGLEVYPGGNPVGVKVSSEGVLVVGYSTVEINDKIYDSPGKESGIEIGDVILKVDGVEMNSSTDLLKNIRECDDGKIDVELLRHGNVINKTIKLLKENDSEYKIGLWIRDSTAGVGTMTFFDPSSHKFGALGHPITDCDTNEPFLIKKGELLDSSIISVRKGEKGMPGELKGIFLNEGIPKGKIEKNTQSGIFGKIDNNDEYSSGMRSIKPIKVGFRDEIKTGSAKIITTIDESGPQEFDIEIEKLLVQEHCSSKSMIIKITDPVLLEKTGGIVQGMSGSPIIQDNKLVGAVTHVLINKPDTGYGIYIEWMLQDAEIIK